ncbi:MAG: Bax inhibitor-1/YccA family protein, partial [Pseudomonadota bacterium]
TGVAALAVVNFAVANSAADAAAQLGNGMMLTQFGVTLYTSPLKWVVMLAPLAFIFLFTFKIQSMSAGMAQIMFWTFAGLMGISLSSIFLVYTSESIVRVFFITAAAFAGLSLFGYTTKKDLSGWGSFLVMGLIGIIIAMLVNIFLQSSALQFAISVIGVLVFAGLTAYDTQRIKESYSVNDDGSVTSRKAIMGALSLYLNFINMFMMLLSLFGNRE